MASTPQQRRAARHLRPDAEAGALPARGRRTRPITVDAVVDAALGIVAEEGYEALTMRRVAAALDTGPASLYAHVVNKEDLGELLIGRLCAEIDLPAPDPAAWRQQITGVCTRLRDQYLRYPGLSRAALAAAPTNEDTLRLAEGMLAVLLAGGVAPQAAAWGIDSLLLYVNAYALEASLRGHCASGWGVGRDELRSRFAALPDTFPQLRRHAAELTAGAGHERFDFTLQSMLDGLARH
ncbi:TetR family transcriptional regulator [Streptomyces sp. 1114.5]|uniref:TetR/AcrR family transcriptional regulator n=1 Tax=unclassified Streptomyces TaxID=2593676 RepID=UPI000BCC3C27|nr:MULTISPECIES: TetR/AcrR family transcriptional regulator [unclassified Streptomyces]RKT12246.1 TetR family transcriptional regulator [Streptomyces sp. 1114.5]SOB79595.1 transcriptional regulator, TetR family [Streptomyces sp. 1331.2]